MTTAGAQAGAEWQPWQDFPQIYGAYEESGFTEAVWFFAKEATELPSLGDAYTYPALAIRYDVHDDRFGVYDITDELVPSEAREYWQEKAKRQAIRNPHFPYELRWPDFIDALEDSGFYEVKDGEGKEDPVSGLVIYNPARKEWKSYTIHNSPITGDLVRLVTLADSHLRVTTEYGISRIDEAKNTWVNYKWRKVNAAGATVELVRVGAAQNSARPSLR